MSYGECMRLRQYIKLILLKVKYFFKYIYIICDNRKKFFIFVSPNSNTNIGDLAILEAEICFIKKYFKGYRVIKIDNDDLVVGWHIERLCRSEDIITINGGGFLGTLWLGEEINVQKVIEAYKNRKIVSFPQTIYYDDDTEALTVLDIARTVYEKNKQLTIHVRERYSQDIGLKFFPNTRIKLCPDIVFSMKISLKKINNRKGALVCFRNDCEKTVDYLSYVTNLLNKMEFPYDITDMVVSNRRYIVNRKKIIYKKMKEFSKYKLVLTDRLHTMAFCAVSGTPCLVFLSKSHKVQGVYEWIKNYSYIKLIRNMNDVEKEIREMISVNISETEFDYDSLEPYYTELANEML